MFINKDSSYNYKNNINILKIHINLISYKSNKHKLIMPKLTKIITKLNPNYIT